MRIIIAIIGCLVIAAEFEAVKQIEEMNHRAQIRAEETDCASREHNEMMRREAGQNQGPRTSG